VIVALDLQDILRSIQVRIFRIPVPAVVLIMSFFISTPSTSSGKSQYQLMKLIRLVVGCSPSTSSAASAATTAFESSQHIVFGFIVVALGAK